MSKTTITRLVDDFERGRLTRRELIATLGALAAGVPAVAAAQPAPEASPGKPTFRALELNHVALRVQDLQRSQAFYERHLGLRTSSMSDSSCFMRFGPHFLALFKGHPAGLDHYCYSIEDYDPAAAARTLQEAGLQPRRRADRIYFDDPDGIEVQVAAPSRRRD